MSPFAEHTRGCYHPNIKYDNKLFKIKKVVGIVFENKLKFDKYVENICQKNK